MRTFAEAKIALGLNPLKTSTFLREIIFPKSGDRIHAGTSVTLYYSEKAGSRLYFQYGSDNAKTISLMNAHKYFSGFSKPPGFATLERWDSQGICKTPTGHKTEPDGFGPDGIPSWLQIMGVI